MAREEERGNSEGGVWTLVFIMFTSFAFTQTLNEDGEFRYIKVFNRGR